jgi:phosphoglycerate dehydrogenase-like enzyme
LNAHTKGFIDARRLKLMKRSAYLINTARGGLVDETALCAALQDKLIAGAAIDVFDPEPLPLDSGLRNSGATLTPHLAATSVESAGNVSRIVARNVIDVLLHDRIECVVNPEALEQRVRKK